MITITKLNNEPIKIVLEKNASDDSINVYVHYNNSRDDFQTVVRSNEFIHEPLDKVFKNYVKPYHLDMTTDF